MDRATYLKCPEGAGSTLSNLAIIEATVPSGITPSSDNLRWVLGSDAFSLVWYVDEVAYWLKSWDCSNTDRRGGGGGGGGLLTPSCRA